MINIEVKINLAGLTESLQRAPATVVKELNKALQKSLSDLRNEMVHQAPFGKENGGDLRKGIQNYKMTSALRGEILSKAPYSGYVEEGTGPHVIRAKGPWPLRDKYSGDVFTNPFSKNDRKREVHHPGTKANPFIERALDKTRQKRNLYFDQAADNIAKSI
jgi:HK97 gp10 family phage protein